MTNTDKLNDEKLLEIAQNMGYDVKKSTDLANCKTQISKMDPWDISKILFFGKTWEQY